MLTYSYVGKDFSPFSEYSDTYGTPQGPVTEVNTFLPGHILASITLKDIPENFTGQIQECTATALCAKDPRIVSASITTTNPMFSVLDSDNDCPNITLDFKDGTIVDWDFAISNNKYSTSIGCDPNASQGSAILPGFEVAYTVKYSQNVVDASNDKHVGDDSATIFEAAPHYYYGDFNPTQGMDTGTWVRAQ